MSVDRIRRLEKHDLAGYVLKKDSPTCGMERVKIRDRTMCRPGTASGRSQPNFSRSSPDLPVEEEGRLNDPTLRENFITRIFAYRRFRDLEHSGPTRGRLMEFHAAHKYTLMSRNQAGMRRLGRLLGEAGRGSSAQALAEDYRTAFTAVMRRASGTEGAHERSPSPGRLRVRRARTGRPGGIDRAIDAVSRRTASVDRSRDSAPSLCAEIRRRDPAKPGVPAAPSARADAPEPRLKTHGRSCTVRRRFRVRPRRSRHPGIDGCATSFREASRSPSRMSSRRYSSSNMR